MQNEQRMIDANEVKKKIWYGNSDPSNLRQYASKWIDEAPTVDAVEVVRCKDCKHCTVTADGMVCECALPTKRMQDYYIYGSTILARVGADDFCSHGERREGE